MIVAAAILLASGLYEQAVSKVIAERFSTVEYVLFESGTGRVIASNWPDVDKPVPVGSLMKPLIAGTMQTDREVTCRPGRCWLPRGHGVVRMADAIAWSCNEWFKGMLDHRRIAPTAIARAYAQVIERAPVVREGMRRAAMEGTAQRLGRKALAKTGTAECAHPKRGPGDGLVIALWPETQPRYLLMVRLHGTTGAVAAEPAGAILGVVRDGR